MKNKVIETIVKSFLKDLSAEQVLGLLPADGDAVKQFKQLIPGNAKLNGDVRRVELPNINAQSEFDELMETFQSVHILTKITSYNE